jgi:hypothetical protein
MIEAISDKGMRTTGLGAKIIHFSKGYIRPSLALKEALKAKAPW